MAKTAVRERNLPLFRLSVTKGTFLADATEAVPAY